MIEEFIGGREIQVAIMGNTKLGAIELRPKRKFYDYQAKYSLNAKTQHIIPVDLPKNKLSQIMNIAIKHIKKLVAEELQDLILNIIMENFIYLKLILNQA